MWPRLPILIREFKIFAPHILYMGHSVLVNKKVGKVEQYESLYPQLQALLHGEQDDIANMANICAALKEVFDFFWVGFYRVLPSGNMQELVLGPFQGPVACTRIAFGKGVCGTAWQQEKTLLVPDVELFPGHIACSALSRSEIVVPVFDAGKVVAVLDVDSTVTNDFDETDKLFLEKIASLVKQKQGK